MLGLDENQMGTRETIHMGYADDLKIEETESRGQLSDGSEEGVKEDQW